MILIESTEALIALIILLIAVGYAFDHFTRRNRETFWLTMRSWAESLEAFQIFPALRTSARAYVRHISAYARPGEGISWRLMGSGWLWFVNTFVLISVWTTGNIQSVMTLTSPMSSVLMSIVAALFWVGLLVAFGSLRRAGRGGSDAAAFAMVVIGLGHWIITSDSPLGAAFVAVTLSAVMTVTVVVSGYCLQRIAATKDDQAWQAVGWVVIDLVAAVLLMAVVAGRKVLDEIWITQSTPNRMDFTTGVRDLVRAYFLSDEVPAFSVSAQFFALIPSLTYALIALAVLLYPIAQSVGIRSLEGAADPEDVKQVQPGKTIALILAVLLATLKLLTVAT